MLHPVLGLKFYRVFENFYENIASGFWPFFNENRSKIAPNTMQVYEKGPLRSYKKFAKITRVVSQIGILTGFCPLELIEKVT